MGRILFLVSVILLIPSIDCQLVAQQKPHVLARAYWDNDFFNVQGHGTDEAYTNGFRLDLYYQQRKRPCNFLGRSLPMAGDSSINIRGWGFGQMMMTPTDLTRTDFQPQDYSYAGALVALHSLYSYNRKKKYGFQTEVMVGARGPESFSAQTQIFIHRLIGDQRPMGWNNQLPGQLIVNVKFTAEKEMVHIGNIAEVIVGTQTLAGTLFNQISVFSFLRAGRIIPYFNGYISQHSARQNLISGNNKRIQAYLIVRPSVGLTIDNDMLNDNPAQTNSTDHPVPTLERWNLNLEYGIEISTEHLGFSFIQKSFSPMLNGLPRHEVGNISVYYSW